MKNLKNIFSYNSWVINFRNHPFISTFFVMLLTYAIIALIMLQIQMGNFPQEYYLLQIDIYAKVLLRSITALLSLVVVYSIIIDNPFNKIHANTIKIIGAIIIITPLITVFINALSTNRNPSNYKTELIFSLFNSINEIILGSLVIIVSEAYQRGYKLKQENDLTV